MLCALAVPVGAQGQEGPWEPPPWVGDVTFLSINSISGGVSAGLFRKLRGGSFREAFLAGMAGGAVNYAGRRVAAARFSGAGLLGRQIATTGASMTRNASEGLATFDQLWFAVGPVNLYVDLGDEGSITPKLNLPAVVSTIYLASLPETRFDLAASVSAGVPVLRTPGKQFRRGDVHTIGMFAYGTIMLGETEEDRKASVFAHERVHALQSDWDLRVWSHPVESELLGRLPGGEAVTRYLDINLFAPAVKVSAYRIMGVEDRDRLYQLEADFLEE
jgi:hypothetical protein